jgi:calcineurin-like phosphoesterase family protein
MKNVFIISDTHFTHQGMCRFLRSDGTKLRPWDDADEMDNAMIHNWNSVVGPKDKVYHLGDVYINRKGRHILPQLNGDKVLIKGNHDIFPLKDYTPYFRDIRAYHVLDKMILSHVPIHVDNLGRFKGNVHGHLHEHVIKDSNGQPDHRYRTVCVEHINYTPIELSVVQSWFQ